MGSFLQPVVVRLKEKGKAKRLIKLLPNEDPKGIWPLDASAEELKKIGPAAVPLLIKELATPERRAAAGRILGEIGDATAVGPLIGVLEDRDPKWEAKHDKSYFPGAASAAIALGKLGDRRATGPLIKALTHPCWFTRRCAAQALGNLGDGRAIEPLIAAVRDEREGVQQGAAEALEKLGWQPSHDEAGIGFFIGLKRWADLEELGTMAVPQLISLIRWDTSSQVKAAEVLARIGDHRAVEPIAAALRRNKSYSNEYRKAHIIALGELGDPRGIPALLDAVAVRTPKVEDEKKNTAEVEKSLARISGEGAVESLIAGLNYKNEVVREVSAKHLGKLGDSKALEPLIKALKARNQNAAMALAELGDKRAVEPLRKARAEGDRGVLLALAKFGDEGAFHTLIDDACRALSINSGPLKPLKESRLILLKGLIDPFGTGPLIEALVELDSRLPPLKKEFKRLEAEIVSLHPTDYTDWDRSDRERQGRLIGEREPISKKLKIAEELHESIVRRLHELTGEHFGPDAKRWHLWWKENNETKTK